MNINIGENIKTLRKNMYIGQEMLANSVGVSVQAVSKWETGQSLPDVGIIPDIAAFFGVSIDSLFFGKSPTATGSEKLTLPNDGKLYIVQILNSEILDSEEWDRDKYIDLAAERFEGTLSVEIWGNANIKGDVSGGLHAGGNAACKNVNGGLHAGGDIACKNIGGGICAGNAVYCGDVVGNVSSGNEVNCGDVVGNVSSGNEVNCGNISGSVNTSGDIRCGDISECGKISCATLYAKSSIECDSIECGGNICTEEKLGEKFD